MSPDKPSTVQKIRNSSGSDAANRRNIAIFSTIGLLDFIIISLYQLGIVRRLPDVPGKIFDSNYVNASKEAQIAGIPDGPVSLTMYAANLILAAVALKRKKKANAFDYIIAGNSIGQAIGGSFYLYTMIFKQKKICLYCVTGALINFATLFPLYKLLRNQK